MNDIVKVVAVKPLGGYRLRIGFSDGSEGERDFADVVAEEGVVNRPLADEGMFARVFVQMGTLAWPSGFDLDAIALHEEMGEAGLLRRAA